ncbi:exodeoxyribonuclease VII large subunit [Gammaproteobacteria bacterium]|jgi:exodeoxyribonuclease VII large subunit|nr:exodeoxyribonuclease VII large subunit [SAR86 cluster bacterium]MDA8709535.1 exodeoxyribonuclease VII large subunit [Gammaproteobacteria bacterium]MDC0919233.1 exodeoxyribonuclease VII large subunit [Gammaproteobacteria bacterium]
MSADIVNQGDEIISVGQLNQQAKTLLENQFRGVSVIGEISNMARPSSGHIYFTLKDEDGAIRCAMFRNQNLRLNFEPQNGDQCILKGQVSLYAPRGDYQLIVSSMQPAGAGNLMHQFEELKKKLDAEGLFAQEIKKQLPKQPKHIGVITSESTAAFQDILTTIQRRAPVSQVSLIPATVQGDTAPKTLIEALQSTLNYNNLNPDNAFDVILICRGGGSIEDLWAFNNESLAREIFDFPLPIISGVGHEIDFTIVDFVADLRAPTPTAAAELVTEYYFQLNDRLEEWKASLGYLVQSRLTEKSQTLLFKSQNLKSPLTMLKEQSQSLDNIEMRLANTVQGIISNAKQNFQLATSKIYQSSTLQRFENYEDRIKTNLRSLNFQMKNLIDKKKLMLESITTNLNAISPLAVLDRGYAIVMNENGQALKSSKDIKVGDTVTTRLGDGGFTSNVSKKD